MPLALALAATLARPVLAYGASLPDNRAYELVTRYAEDGREVGLNGAEAGSRHPVGRRRLPSTGRSLGRMLWRGLVGARTSPSPSGARTAGRRRL